MAATRQTGRNLSFRRRARPPPPPVSSFSSPPAHEFVIGKTSTLARPFDRREQGQYFWGGQIQMSKTLGWSATVVNLFRVYTLDFEYFKNIGVAVATLATPVATPLLSI